jgi:hypothetical protein
MLNYLVCAFLVFAGWRRFPWWTPVAAVGVATPVTLFQLSRLNAWFAQIGLETPPIQPISVALILAPTFALWFALYWSGRGAAHLAASRKASQGARAHLQPRPDEG